MRDKLKKKKMNFYENIKIDSNELMYMRKINENNWIMRFLRGNQRGCSLHVANKNTPI